MRVWFPLIKVYFVAMNVHPSLYNNLGLFFQSIQFPLNIFGGTLYSSFFLYKNLKILPSIEFPKDIFSLFSLRLALVILLPPKGTWFGIKTTTNKFPQNAFSGGYSISSFLKLGNFVSQVRVLPPRQSGCGAVGSAKVFNDIEIPAWKNIKIFLKILLT